jgi:hypothetical protein
MVFDTMVFDAMVFDAIVFDAMVSMIFLVASGVESLYQTF